MEHVWAENARKGTLMKVNRRVFPTLLRMGPCAKSGARSEFALPVLIGSWLLLANVGYSQDSAASAANGSYGHYGVMVASLTDPAASAKVSDAQHANEFLGIIGGASRPKPLSLSQASSTKSSATAAKPAPSTKTASSAPAKPAIRYLHNDPWYIRTSSASPAASSDSAAGDANPASAVTVSTPATIVNYVYPVETLDSPSAISLSDRTKILPDLWNTPIRVSR